MKEPGGEDVYVLAVSAPISFWGEVCRAPIFGGEVCHAPIFGGEVCHAPIFGGEECRLKANIFEAAHVLTALKCQVFLRHRVRFDIKNCLVRFRGLAQFFCYKTCVAAR